MLVSKSEMAAILDVAMTTLNEWIRKDDAFPIHSRGSNGIAWQFDPEKVLAHLQQRAEEEQEEHRRRAEQMRQTFLPLTELDLQLDPDGKFSPQQELARTRKRMLEAEMRREAAFLIRTDDLQQALETILLAVSSSFQRLPSDMAARFGLSGAVEQALARYMETFEHNFQRELRPLMREPSTQPQAEEPLPVKSPQ